MLSLCGGLNPSIDRSKKSYKINKTHNREMPRQKIKQEKEMSHHRHHLVRYQHEELEMQYSTNQPERDIAKIESNVIQEEKHDRNDLITDQKASLRNTSIDMRIFVVGCTLMLITGLPNFNLALASSISGSSGIVSSALFGIGGSLGGFQKQWKYLYIAGILQVVTIAFVCIETEWDERYQRLEEDAYFISQI